jgi:hypothetical protein
MEDEKYIFYEDSKQKKQIARSAFAKNHHGGRVRLPSDNMTGKELRKMSGEVKAYRMNELMKWKEFKALPDDLKVAYIKNLREKWDVPDTYIAKMLGIGRPYFAGEIGRLGLSRGKIYKRTKYDREGFCEWAGIGEQQETPQEVAEPTEPELTEDIPDINTEDIIAEETKPYIPCIPTTGHLNFTDNADKALDMVKAMLADQKVKISVIWEVIE